MELEEGKSLSEDTLIFPESANYGETSFEMVIHIQNGIMSADIDSVTGDYDGKPHSIKVTARDLKLKDKNDTTESGTGETGAEGSGETGTEETVDPSLKRLSIRRAFSFGKQEKWGKWSSDWERVWAWRKNWPEISRVLCPEKTVPGNFPGLTDTTIGGILEI